MESVEGSFALVGDAACTVLPAKFVNPSESPNPLLFNKI